MPSFGGSGFPRQKRGDEGVQSPVTRTHGVGPGLELGMAPGAVTSSDFTLVSTVTLASSRLEFRVHRERLLPGATVRPPDWERPLPPSIWVACSVDRQRESVARRSCSGRCTVGRGAGCLPALSTSVPGDDHRWGHYDYLRGRGGEGGEGLDGPQSRRRENPGRGAGHAVPRTPHPRHPQTRIINMCHFKRLSRRHRVTRQRTTDTGPSAPSSPSPAPAPEGRGAGQIPHTL